MLTEIYFGPDPINSTSPCVTDPDLANNAVFLVLYKLGVSFFTTLLILILPLLIFKSFVIIKCT